MRRGHALLVVLVSLTVLLGLLLILAQAAVHHLGFAAALESRQQARNLAEAAVAEGLARVLDDDTFGANRRSGRGLSVRGSNGSGTLTFNEIEGGGMTSTNNLNGTSSVPGSGRSVPKGTLHLLGVGRCGGVTRVVEVLYYRPPFPFGASASGPIEAPGGLSVVGLTPGSTPPATGSGERAASSLRTLDGGDPAISLGAGCQVMGDLSAPGVVRVDPAALVSGEVRSHDAPGRLPVVDVQALIAAMDSVSGAAEVRGTVGPLLVDWATGCPADLTVRGDLSLKQGVLFVHGNLEVHGGVKGEGLILVEGTTRILGGADLSAQNLVAIGSWGDVELLAPDRQAYHFQGLIYSQGNLVARQITVLGSLITNAPPGSGQMTLENMTLIQDPRSAYEVFPIPEQAFERDPPIDPPSDDVYRHPTWVSVWPEMSPNGPTGEYFVRIVVPAPASKRFDRRWKVPSEITIAELKRQYDPIILHDDAWQATLDRMVAQVGSRTNPYVIRLDANSLLTPSERARVLLWREL